MKIRKALPADADAVFKLVYELAVYERAPEKVLTNAETYLKGFGDGIFEAFVAENENIFSGSALQ